MDTTESGPDGCDPSTGAEAFLPEPLGALAPSKRRRRRLLQPTAKAVADVDDVSRELHSQLRQGQLRQGCFWRILPGQPEESHSPETAAEAQVAAYLQQVRLAEVGDAVRPNELSQPHIPAALGSVSQGPGECARRLIRLKHVIHKRKITRQSPARFDAGPFSCLE